MSTKIGLLCCCRHAIPGITSWEKGEEPNEDSNTRHGYHKYQPPPQENIDLFVEQVIRQYALHSVLV